MRILLVTSRYPPYTGGVERHVSAVAERLVARGHEVTVRTADATVARGGTRTPARRERRNGARVVRHRSVTPGGAFHVAPGVLPAVRRADADVVHAHNYHSLPLLLAALGSSARVRGGSSATFVATPHYHGASASRFRNRLLRAYRPIGGRALRGADAVVAVGDRERRALARDFGVAAEVIPNGLDVERFAEATPAPPATHAARDRPYLLCVGRLEAYKGVQHAIRALPRLEHALLVAGTGPAESDLRRVAREVGVEDRVRFLGYVPDDELPGLYAGAEAFVALSAFEAYGMTVAEALAAGTPCVVRQAGALGDWAARDDCVGVEFDGDGDASAIDAGGGGGGDGNARPADAVAAGVAEAVGRRAPSEPLPTWDEAVDALEALYRRVA
ncbi:glycosyltransferase family 4 protein [Halegenticoccus tardaugens]|uniref:glycosyltransferase family 4 protein n=1 Tax=Halegenticoccus tardaugens TaxID=2071624 RepID=UPI00100C2630|nr:glycosyltransferase family 4 protein [Halegenticoccus tardaugens]